MRKSGKVPPVRACFNKCMNTQKSPKPKLDPSDVQLAFHMPASFSFGKPVFVAMAATCAPVTPSARGSFKDFLSVYHAFLERSRSSRLIFSGISPSLSSISSVVSGTAAAATGATEVCWRFGEEGSSSSVASSSKVVSASTLLASGVFVNELATPALCLEDSKSPKSSENPSSLLLLSRPLLSSRELKSPENSSLNASSSLPSNIPPRDCLNASSSFASSNLFVCCCCCC